jgi:hypothetical protein
MLELLLYGQEKWGRNDEAVRKVFSALGIPIPNCISYLEFNRFLAAVHIAVKEIAS